MHESGSSKGDFGVVEVWREVGRLDSHNTWKCGVNLTAEEREHKMYAAEPSTKYAVTVRGLVLPDSLAG